MRLPLAPLPGAEAQPIGASGGPPAAQLAPDGAGAAGYGRLYLVTLPTVDGPVTQKLTVE